MSIPEDVIDQRLPFDWQQRRKGDCWVQAIHLQRFAA